MIRHTIIYGVFLAAIITAAEVSAQKYPERHEARDGNKAYNKGDFSGAEVHYRRALEINPEFREARFNLGDAVFRQEKGEEAAKIFTDIAADSLTAPAMMSAANFNAGNVMLAGQKIEEAIEFYKQALRIDPTDMQAKYNLAYAQKMLKNPPQQDQNQDQNKDQNKDQNRQDQNKDQDQDQNKDQQTQNQDQDQDQQDGQGDQNQDHDQGEPPKPDHGEGDQQEAAIDPQDAEHMLEAMQDEEDKTREKMNAKEVPAVGRSGKNW